MRSVVEQPPNVDNSNKAELRCNMELCGKPTHNLHTLILLTYNHSGDRKLQQQLSMAMLAVGIQSEITLANAGMSPMRQSPRHMTKSWQCWVTK